MEPPVALRTASISSAAYPDAVVGEVEALEEAVGEALEDAKHIIIPAAEKPGGETAESDAGLEGTKIPSCPRIAITFKDIKCTFVLLNNA